MHGPQVTNVTPGTMSSLRRDLFTAMLPILFGIEILASIVYLPIALRGNADFRQFYTGGYMLRAGDRHRLYDYDLQEQISHSPLPAVHPAYEYLLFVPLSLVGYRTAYFTWLIVNLGLWGAAIYLLRKEFHGPLWLLASIGLALVPVWVTFAQGQDSLLLLDLLLLANSSKSDFRAGLWLGAGSFKFHIVVPIVLIYLLWRKWKFVAGTCVAAGAAVVVSVALVGLHGSVQYIATASNRAATQLHPGAMPNLYGVMTAMLNQRWAAAVLAIVGALAALLFVRAQKPSLANAVSVVPLIAFYFMGHDLTIFLLPIVSFELWIPWLGAALILLPGHAYLAALPIAGGCLLRSWQNTGSSSHDASTRPIEQHALK